MQGHEGTEAMRSTGVWYGGRRLHSAGVYEAYATAHEAYATAHLSSAGEPGSARGERACHVERNAQAVGRVVMENRRDGDVDAHLSSDGARTLRTLLERFMP